MLQGKRLMGRIWREKATSRARQSSGRIARILGNEGEGRGNIADMAEESGSKTVEQCVFRGEREQDAQKALGIEVRCRLIEGC